jgi:3-oxoacyl-[acyl-carrier-protein] synthase III
MMLGLSRIGLHVPDERECVPTLMRQLGRPEPEIRRFERLFNLQTVPVAREDKLEHLLRRALNDLEATEDLTDVGLVLFAHTALPQVPSDYDLFGRVLATAALDHLPAYGVAHVNCAALFRALELAQAWLGHFPRRSVLVLAGDHASFIPQARLVPGVSVMGDAAIAFLASRGRIRYRLRGRAWMQDTRFHRGVRMNVEEAMAFNALYLGLLGQVIDACLDSAGVSLEEVDHILPHNVNEMTWSRFARERGYPRERIFMDLIPVLGHTMTTDAFLNLETAARWSRVRVGDRCLLVGVGTGSYFAAALVEIADEETA